MIDVTVVVPCFNEEKHIEKCINSIYESLENSKYTYEIIVSDGGSTDKTRDILGKLSVKNFNLIENTRKLQVYALNQMIELAKGRYIVRCDAHAVYPKNYVSQLVGFLENNPSVGNVGAPILTKGLGDVKSESIAVSLNSLFGVGGGHRSGRPSRPVNVDTVLFGAWRREIFHKVGLFNETYIRGQDVEHNCRIRNSGYEVKQINSEPLVYHTRDRYRKLFKMIMQYGSVKPKLYADHKVVPTLRSMVPFLFYIFILLLSVKYTELAIYIFLSYLVVGLISANVESRRAKKGSVFKVLFCYVLMHFAHFVGVSTGMYYWLSGKTKVWEHTR